ncbi:ABC-F family ATP-binding cassette domain-containing protein [Clostridium sp. UBA7339]|uniref:ABC-F family ATP-binding cassette domain-containing protein n=1 Tax=Clostridium sp. UBA7339 TaxID=1946376 RepID=UPI003217D19E
MGKIIIKNISKSFQNRTILNNISFEIGDNFKIGLVGENGVGKSTLKQIITKEISYDEGSINYIPSNILIGIIDENLYNNNTFLSGGEATKKEILNIFHSNYDLFILDEPTNHLDLSGVQWLERLINSINKPMIIISHDRFFLDEVTNKTFVLSNNGIKTYEGNYSSYEKQLLMEKITNENLYNKQQQEIRALKENISQRKQWFNKAHKMAGTNDHLRALSKKHVSIMRSKEKKLEKLKENGVERIKDNSSIKLTLNNNNSFKTAIRVENLSKSFDKKLLFKDGNFTINGGDKVGIIGNNGSGKTTLLNILLGEDKNYIGDVYLNPNMKISSLSQYLEVVNEEITILDYLLTTNETENIIRLYLGSVFIKGDRVNTLIKNLSMGEKCRVIFTKIIIENPDLIILDEPTNYMDILSKESVSLLLKSYSGTALVVSHDRHLISTVCNRILKIENNKIINFTGNHTEIIEFFTCNKTSNSKSKVNKDEILMLQCRLSQLSGLLDDPSLEKDAKLNYEKEFLNTSRRISELRDMKYKK